MPTLIGSLIRQATRKPNDKLNILCMPTHERYQVGLAGTGHNFYLWRGPGIKDWDITYAPVPSNCYLLNPNLGNNQIPVDLDLDLILSQNKAGQLPVAQQLSKQLHLPIISLEHCLPSPDMEKRLPQIKSMRGHINVFISEYSRERWGWTAEEAEVIHHGIDTNVFCYTNEARKTQVLSVVNDFANRNWCCGWDLWRQVTAGLPTKLLGKNPGLSEPAKSVEDLADNYRTSKVFLNTSLISPVPTSLMEAMACGCACVSTNNCMIPYVISNGVNGFLCDTPEEMREKLELLLEDTALAVKLGQAARQTIVERFPMSKFIESWNSLFQKAAGLVYTGEP